MLLLFLQMIVIIYACEDTGCPAGQSCNPYDNTCYEDAPEPSRPAVWLGDAPDNCDRGPQHCELFDLQYDISHPKGDGDFCGNGTKVRCLIKEAPVLQTSPVNELRVVAYNIFERGFFISYDGQRERTCRIVMWLLTNHPNLDAICFQEAFMGGCFADSLNMRDIMTYYNFTHFTETLESEDQPYPGGIFVASRWPITVEKQLIYANADPDSWDDLAAKGVSYAKILKSVDGSEKSYHIMSTHMQAGGPISTEIRQKQCAEWNDFVINSNIDTNEAVIYAGDFNQGRYGEQFRNCSTTLQAEIPEKIGPWNFTSDPATNDLLQLIKPGGSGSWIDFVLYSRNHLQPIDSSQLIIQPTADEKFPVCWCEQCVPVDYPDYVYPDDPECGRVESIKHLSDHYPVLGTFIF